MLFFGLRRRAGDGMNIQPKKGDPRCNIFGFRNYFFLKGDGEMLVESSLMQL